MIQHQTQKKSGSRYHLNLDPITYAALYACQQTYRSHGQNFSNSVIVRRALRALLEKLEVMPERVMEQEIMLTKRAARGVL
jgi:hypothetical protein